ncbi:MAG: rhodanese-like domain-containing protein [bacterium]|nr:rhodanese-like domain-containing protein [bacterium]
MTKRWTLMALLLIALAALVGCSSDDDPVTPTATTFETMATAVEAYLNDNTDCPGTVTAQALHDNLDDYTVVDIRSADAYLAGHIPGAYNSSLATILTDVGTTIPTDKTIVIACYSGQSAGHAKIALELMGHEDVKTLGFGMSSWNSTLASGWNSNVGDNLPAPETTNNNADLTVHAFPTLTGTNATIVATRVAAMVAAGFQSITWATLQPNLDDYFVVNYFGQADYEGTGAAGVPGHIPGAYQFTPYASLGFEQMLENLPSDDTPIVVYCWTGQHSSQVVAALNMLGYNAKSLSYGSNHLFHGSLTANRWTAASTNDFELEVGGAQTPEFAAVYAAVDAYLNDTTDSTGPITAVQLNDNLSLYTVIDIRSATDYAAGHITGAYNSSLATLLNDLATTIPNDKTYVIACYTGQSAGHAKIAMELMGYEDVKFLKWGMCSWNSTLASRWNDNVGDNLPAAETTNNNGSLVAHAYPTLTDGDTVEDRVAAMLAAGFQSVTWTAPTPPDLTPYFILNYFGVADYEGTGTNGVPGHIPGAFQFTPYTSLKVGEMLPYLPSDGTPILVYCWTGQTSSQVAAALNMLGYNAKSLSYGSNRLFHTPLLANKWTAAETHDFTLTTAVPAI